MLQFSSPLQVEPAAEMALAFTAKPRPLAKVDPSLWCGFGLFALLLVCAAGVGWMGRLGTRLHETLSPAAKPANSARPHRPSGPSNTDDSTGQVSADELL